MNNKVLPNFIGICLLVFVLSLYYLDLLRASFFVGLYFFLYYELLIGEKSSYSIWLSALLKGIVVMVVGYITLGESWGFALFIFYPILFIFLLGLPVLILYKPKEDHNEFNNHS